MKSESKKVLICGGGTAGHIYPAIALIEYIKEHYPDYKILFIGTNKGMENKFIPKLSIDFIKIKASGLKSSKNFINKIMIYLKFFFNLLLGLFKSIKILACCKPDAILGMGGYVCAPLLLAAIITGKKYYIHEQNFIPGRLNKIFSKYAKNIFVSFKETESYFPEANGKVIYSGNPIRKIIKNFDKKAKNYKKWGLDKNKFTIVAFGGSLGAGKLNKIIIDLCNYFGDKKNMQIVLIAGKRFFNDILKIKDNLNPESGKLNFKILSYVEEMDEIYNIADLIISRAGANTIAELIETKVPAILIPFPYAIGNHQYYNAKFLAERGAAIIILDRDLNSKRLIDNIEGLVRNNMDNYKKFTGRKNILKNKNSEKIIIDNMIRS